MAQVGTVQSLSGHVVAKSLDGQVRELNVGDLVNQNDIVEVAAASSVVISLDDGELISLTEYETIFLDESVVSSVESRDSVVEDVAAMQDTVAVAIENNQDPGDLFDAPAAGPEALDESYDFNAGYHAGDTTRGDVGTYLLQTEFAGQDEYNEEPLVVDTDAQFVADTVEQQVLPEIDDVAPIVIGGSSPTQPGGSGGSGENGAPNPVNGTITMVEDLSNTNANYQVRVEDFGQPFDDPMTAVKISSLPENGVLLLNGQPVAPGQVISTAEINAGNLQFDPVDHTDADSSFTYQVQSGALWGATSQTAINIEGLADVPNISLQGTYLISHVIDASNVNEQSSGYSVSAFSAFAPFSIDVNGVSGEQVDIGVNPYPEGFGVAGAASGGDAETGYNADTGLSEHLVFSFTNAVAYVDVSFAWKAGSDSPTGETAQYDFYRNGVKVGETQVDYGGSDTIDPEITLMPTNGELFDTIVFSAHEQEPGSFTNDYLIHSLTYHEVETSSQVIHPKAGEVFQLDVTQSLVDTDGSESLSAPSLTGMPPGTFLSDGTQTVTISGYDQSVELDGWNLSQLTMTVDPDQVGAAGLNFTITASTTATELSNNDTASASAHLKIEVQPPVPAQPNEHTGIISGGDGDDTLIGDVGNESFEGKGGDDAIYGRGGDDNIAGEDGDDILVGGEGSDTILGGDGDDIIVFDGTDSLVDGGDGFDTLVVKDSGDLDFSKVKNIERIELAGQDDQAVELSIADVIDMTDSDNRLEFGGEGEKQVTLNDDGYTSSVPDNQATPGDTPETFTNNNDPTQVVEIINTDPDPAGEIKVITDDGTEVG